MPASPVTPEVDAFLRKPNPCVIATLRPDGAPHTAAGWFAWEDGRVLTNMDDDRLRLAYMRRDPRVSLTVTDVENWYWQVSLMGRVVSIEEDAGLHDADRLSNHYTGSDYPTRDRRRWSAWIEVDRWHGWDPIRFARWEPGVSDPPV
jgi:PPOX class probable F420-dependent enzyme